MLVSLKLLNVNAEFPHLGASPDRVMSWSCHRKVLLEIKCPHKYRNELSGWDSDPGFPISSNGCMDEGPSNACYRIWKNYFYIWTKTKTDNFILITVQKDNNFLKKITEKFEHLFEVVILSELASQKSDVENTENEKLYCICKRPSFLPMIACDGTNCKIEWFYYACVKIKKAPRNNWHCKECK